MYPLNLTKPGDQPGYALANDEAEHQALSDLGYEPKLEKAAEQTKEEVMAALDAAGVEYDKRWGLERLKALLQ